MNICYNLAGDKDDRYQRCNTTNSTAHSACCAINKQSPDICLDSGLCLATETYYMGGIFENGCTDFQGADDACPKVCTRLRKNNSTVEVAEVFRCLGGKWCCRPAGSSTNCCDDSSAQEVGTSQMGNVKSSINNAIRAVSNGSETGSNTTDVNSNTDSKTAVVVGGVLGGVLLAALVGLATALWLWRRERRERRALQRQGAAAGPNLREGAEMVSGDHQNGSGLLEADPMHERIELPGGHRKRSSHELSELPVRNYA